MAAEAREIYIHQSTQEGTSCISRPAISHVSRVHRREIQTPGDKFSQIFRKILANFESLCLKFIMAKVYLNHFVQNQMAQKHSKNTKTALNWSLFIEICLGRQIGRFLSQIGLFFGQNIWSHWLQACIYRVKGFYSIGICKYRIL